MSDTPNPRLEAAREKLKVLRKEFAANAVRATASEATARPDFQLSAQPAFSPSRSFKRKSGKTRFEAAINARITVQIPVSWPLVNGDRVIGMVDVRVHALDPLQGDDRQQILSVLEAALELMREEMRFNP